MIVFIRLTTAGTNTGPFNLYSDLDPGNPFTTVATPAELIAGISWDFGAGSPTTITIVSTGVCTNNIILTINSSTTTTTTTTIIL